MNNKLLFLFLTLFICFNSCSYDEQEALKKDEVSTDKPERDLVYSVPGMDQVLIKKDISFTDLADSTLTMDIYYPPKFEFNKNIPAVLVVCGFDKQAMDKLGVSIKGLRPYISWSKLIAVSGMASILYEPNDPSRDLKTVLNYIQNEGNNLKIDKSKIGLFASSGHVPLAISNSLNKSNDLFRCAVFYYGWVLSHDFKHISSIDSLADKFGFSNARLASTRNWRIDMPILLVRAGLEQFPYLNDSIGHFYNKAIDNNLPITVINYSRGHHGFDSLDDNDETREIIKRTIYFWQYYLK